MPITTTGAGLASGGTELSTPFDYSIESELSTPFYTERDDLGVELVTPFDMAGSVGTELSTPFDMTGLIDTELSTPFDMVQSISDPSWGNPVGTPATHVFLTAGASIGATVLNVNSTSLIAPGQTIVLSTGEVVTVDVVLSPTSFSITTPLAQAVSAGSSVAIITLTAPVLPGDTTVTVTSTTGLTPGTVLTIGGETVVVGSITSPTTFTITSPFAYSHASGDALTALSGFQPVLLIFDKGGTQLGTITTFGITSPPTQAIMNFRASTAAQGSMTFIVPRTLEDGETPNPEADLIFDDRFVVVGLEIGGPLWGGSITVQESSAGVIQAECTDMFGQFVNTPSIEVDEEMTVSTPAWSVIAEILNTFNSRKATDGELTWAIESSGSKVFRGSKFSTNGDAMTAIQTVVENAGIELMWRISVGGGQLSTTLVVADKFESASSFAIQDGANGNIMANPRIIRDPTNVVHEITLTGEPTDLSDCMPEYAQWAITNSTPTVTVSVDPGPLRRRAKLDVSVPWGYSAETIAGLCSETLDQVWDMYYSFLRAIHDMEGRPFHKGFLWEGVPSTYFDSRQSGSTALSRQTWRTRLQLVETFTNTPASAIMISDATAQNNRNSWLIVTYNRQTDTQVVRYWPVQGAGAAAGASVTKWQISGTTIIYTVSGTRIIDRVSFFSASTGAFCESYNTRVYDPVDKRYRNLRRVTAGGFYGKYIDPADPDLTFSDYGSDAGVAVGDFSQLVGKIYDFELYNVDLWDPYRDGIGVLKSALTLYNAAPTTRERWHLVSYNAGDNASTSIVYGVSATDTEWVVESAAGFPTPETGDFPFKIQIDDGLATEIVMVVGAEGLLWTVQRGQDGTTAIVHEPGTGIRRLGAGAPTGLTPTDIPWPEGQAYAEELLAMLSQATIAIELDIANIDDAWREADFGAVMPVIITTEGAGGGFNGTARVVGRSPDPFGAAGPAGSMKVVLEVATGG
jgi:hypothetical protein